MPNEDSDDPESYTEVFEPVCRKWLQINAITGAMECMWPKGKVTAARLQNLVHKQVNPDSSWELHPCEVVSSYENYLEAHLGAKARETNPQYETEKEVGKLRRRIRRNILTSDEDEDDPPPNKPLPPPPKINSKANKTFKPITSGKSPVKVTVSSSGNGLSKMPLRKNRGSKVSDIADLKAMLSARREKAKGSQLKSNDLTVVSTSPCWKAKTAAELEEGEDPAKGVDDFSEGNETFPTSPKSNVSRKLFASVTKSPLKAGQKSSSSEVRSQENPIELVPSRNRSPSLPSFLQQSPETLNFSPSPQSERKHHSDRSASLQRSIHRVPSQHLARHSSKDVSPGTFNFSPSPQSKRKHYSDQSASPQHSPERVQSQHLAQHLMKDDSLEIVNFSPGPSPKKKRDASDRVASHHLARHSSKNDASALLSQQRSSELLSETTFSSFEKKVLVGMKELKEMLHVISANQSKLNLNLLPNEKVISRPDGMPALPVKTMRELQSLESYLEESDNLSNISVYLSAFVSKKETDEAKSALKVVSKVMGNALASKFSLQGLKGKLKFTDLKLWSAIQGAILWKLETDLSQTQKAVANWLKNAPWRSHEDSSAPKRQSSSKSGCHEDLSASKRQSSSKSGSVPCGKSQSKRGSSQ